MNIARIFVLFTTLAAYANGQAQRSAASYTNYVSAVTRSGDDAKRFLQRYDLGDRSCNVAQFFKINKLKESDRLPAGQSLLLPIVITTYNGKSIRSTLGISDWQTAKRIADYNQKARQMKWRDDDFIISKKLWTPWHELECKESKSIPLIKTAAASLVLPEYKPVPNLPSHEPASGKNSRIYPIFGPRYANTPLSSNRLKGKVYYIVSGHGGPDPGARGKRSKQTLCEDEYAYDVSLRLLRLLVSHGATAFMIVRDPNDGIREDAFLRCDEDEEVLGGGVIPRNQRDRLQQRCDIINTLTERHRKAGVREQVFIEIHVDSRNKQAKTDAFFYYRPESDISRSLALHFHRKFEQKYHQKQGGRLYSGTVTPRGLYMLENTTTPIAVYIELANIQNDWDQQRLVIKNNRQALANWLCEALLRR